MKLSHQKAYWNRVATERTFTIPLDKKFIISHVDRQSAILDYGCGYGRSLNELYTLGYKNLIGMDISEEMIKRGKEISPHLDLRCTQDNQILLPDHSVSIILLFATLTCMVEDEDISQILAEIKRVLVPGGYVIMNDFLLNNDDRNVTRYKYYQEQYGTYGIFELPDGVILRHFNDQYLDDLLSKFEIVDRRKQTFVSMNGNPLNGIQYILTVK